MASMSTASVVGFTQAIVNLNSTGLIGLITTIPKLIAGVVSLTATFGASQVAALGLNGVLELLNINPVMLALSAATIAIGGIVYAQKKAAEDAQQRIDDINSKLSELNDKLSTLNGEYDSLLKKVKDGSATDAEKERLQLINDEIEATKELIKQQTKLKYQEEFGQTTSYETDEYGGVVPVSSNSKTQTDIEKSISDAKKLSDISGKTTAEMDKNHTDMATYISDMQSYISDLEQYEGQGLLTSQQQSDLDTMRQMVSEYGKYDNAVSAAQRALAAYVTEQEAQGNTLSEISQSNAYKLLVSDLNEATKAENANSDAMKNNADATASLSVALESYSSLISKLSGNFDLVAQAEKELSDNGVLQYSTVQKLLEAYPSLQNSLTLTKNGFVTTKEALDGLITSQIAEYQTANDNAVSAANTLINSETAKQLGYKATTASIYDQIAAMQKLAASQLAMAGSDFINRRLSAGDTLTEASQSPEYQAIVAKANSRYLKVTAAYNNLVASSANLNAAKNLASSIKSSEASKSGSSGSSSKDSTELYIADIDKLANAEQRLTDVQNKLSTEDVLKDLASNSDQKTAIIQKEIDLYKEEQKALENLNTERRKQIQENADKLTAQGFNVVYDPWKNNFEVTNLEHINKLKGKDVDQTNELRKAAESLIDSTNTLNSDAIKGTQDWLSAVKNIKDEYSDMQSIVSNTVDKAFDKVSDLLDKEKEAYETQKSNLESVASTVTSYINDYIDSLQAENDELDKQISLQEKLESLDKAKTQRNKRIFKSGVGFVWSADQSAVNSAQQEYDSALREYNLEAEIQDLKDYAQAWQDAVDSYENSANEALTASILGSNWKSKVLGTNYSTIKDFKSEYNGVLSELDESVYGSVAYQIKNLEDWQEAWNDSKDTVDGVSTDYKDILDLIQTYESKNYETRLTALSSFVTSAISQYKALAAAASSFDGATSVSTSTNSSKNAISSAAKTALGVAGAIVLSVSGVGKKSYSEGGIVDYTGTANVHGATAAEMMLNNVDVAKVYDYIHSGDILSQTASNMLAASNMSVKTSVTPNSNQNVTLSVGDVYLSGINDSNSLADAIVKKLPSQILQKFYKK